MANRHISWLSKRADTHTFSLNCWQTTDREYSVCVVNYDLSGIVKAIAAIAEILLTQYIIIFTVVIK